MAEIDFTALIKSELAKQGIDPNSISIPPGIPIEPSSALQAQGYAENIFRGGAAAICTAFGLPGIAPICGEAGATLIKGIIALGSIGGPSQQEIEELHRFFNPSDDNAPLLSAIGNAETSYFKVVNDSIESLVRLEQELKLVKPRNKWEILESLYDRDWKVLPVRLGKSYPATKSGPFKRPAGFYQGCDDSKSPFCYNDMPGVPDFINMPAKIGYDATIAGLKAWPNAFANILAAETAGVIAKSIAEKQEKVPFRFIRGLTLTPKETIMEDKTSSASKGGGFVLIGLAVLGGILVIKSL